MSNSTAVTSTVNIVPVQGLFKPEPTFELITFIGPAGTPFLPPTSPFLDGVTITNSTIDSSVIGGTAPAAGYFTNVYATTGQIATTPSGSTDIANKAYVDSVAQGLDIKASCVYTTTGNITLSGLGTQSGGDWGVSLTAGDRILVKNQASSQFNGIYVASASTWSRATDMDTWSEVPSAFTFIEDGTTLADTGWVCTANRGGTIDVTPMPWTQFSGAGAYTAGNGLQLVANQFSVVPNGTTINVSASGIKIADTYPGQTSITTLGTITSGTWNGSTIGVAYGGTGLTSYTTGDLLYASGATTLAKLADVATGNALISGGVGVAPSWGKIGLATHVSGTLPIANGGTGDGAIPTAGAVAYGNGSSYAFSAVGTAGQYLQSTGSGAPAWSTISSGVGATGYYGAFYDSGADQTAASTTAAYVVRVGSVGEANGISVVTNGSYLSRITVANSGTYTFTPSIQFVSTDTSINDVQVWFRKNGTDVANSNSQFSVPNKHGGINGNLIAMVSFTITLVAGDYIEMVWATDNTAVYIHSYPAGTTPTTPVIPGVIVTATSQPQIGIGYYGLSSSTTVTPGTGTKSFVTNLPASSVAFTVGTAVRIAYPTDPTQFMQGVITSFTGTNMDVLVDAFSGSTPRSTWNISVAGSSGVTSFSGGSTGLTPSSATYGAVTLAGTLGSGYGGTGFASYTAGDTLYANGSGLTKLAIGASTTIMTSSGTSPQWSAASGVSVGTASNLAGGAAASIPYQSGAGATAFLASAAGDAGKVLQSNGTSAPSWVTPTAYATVTDDTTTNATRYPLFANQTTGNLSTEYTSSTKLQYNPSTGVFTATGFSGSGANLTSLPAGQLSGTIPSGVLGNSTLYVGTTAIALNRASGSQTLTGTSIDGSAGSATTATTATNANNVAITDNTSSVATWYPVISANSSGNNPATTSSTKLSFVPSTGTLSSSVFSGAGTGLTGTASSLSIGGTAALATNVAGGLANQIHYQTGAGATSFITAPSVASTFLSWNGSAFAWASAGTVTSVGMTVPSFLSVSGSPITGSGTLAVTLSGTALPTANGGTGLTSFTANGVVYASSSSTLATGGALVFDGTNLGIGTNAPAYRIDAWGAAATIRAVGTSASNPALILSSAGITAWTQTVSGTDASLSWNRDGSEKGRFDANGNWLVGTVSSPSGNGNIVAAGAILNTRINPRVSSTTSTSSITPDVSAYDQYCVTAQAATLTINAPTGTPVDGNKLIFRILDNGTSQTLSWNATFTAIGVTLPTATTINKMTYVGAVYNAANTRWDVIAVTTQA